MSTFWSIIAEGWMFFLVSSLCVRSRKNWAALSNTSNKPTSNTRNFASSVNPCPFLTCVTRSFQPFEIHPSPSFEATQVAGKTTQIPQYILDDHLMSSCAGYCNIIITQPRRISAIFRGWACGWRTSRAHDVRRLSGILGQIRILSAPDHTGGSCSVP